MGGQAGTGSAGVGKAGGEIEKHLSGQVNPMSKCLIIIKVLKSNNLLSDPEKGILKDLALQQDHRVLGTLDAYEVDRDVSELIDTMQRICRICVTR